MRRARLFAIPVLLIVGLGVYVGLAPDGIDPSDAWTPPPAPALEGALAPNERLIRARPVAKGKVTGPESVAPGPGGRLYTGLADGRLVAIDVEHDAVQTLASTGETRTGCGEDPGLEPVCGRPLGLRIDASGKLIVADAERGLLSMGLDGQVTTLARGVGDTTFTFLDDLDIAADGSVYFTEASTKYPRRRFRDDILENGAFGRLLRYVPSTKKVEVLLDKLYFANGVQLTPDEDAVLVVETSRYRIQRYHLKGPKAGTAEIFAENLPGMPDNLRRSGDGGYWLALGAERNPTIDALHAHPLLKRIVHKLVPLEFFQRYFVPKIGLVVKLDAEGKIVESLWDPTGNSVADVSEAREHEGRLYIGSLDADRVGVLDLGTKPPDPAQ